MNKLLRIVNIMTKITAIVAYIFVIVCGVLLLIYGDGNLPSYTGGISVFLVSVFVLSVAIESFISRVIIRK